MPMTQLDTASSLVDLLNVWTERRPHSRAFVCLDEDGAESEVLTFAELDRRQRSLAGRLRRVAQAGDRALLIFPTCLSFVVAFFGCLYAGVIAVPIVPPRIKRLRESTFSIVHDCDPRLGLTITSDRESITA